MGILWYEDVEMGASWNWFGCGERWVTRGELFIDFVFLPPRHREVLHNLDMNSSSGIHRVSSAFDRHRLASRPAKLTPRNRTQVPPTPTPAAKPESQHDTVRRLSHKQAMPGLSSRSSLRGRVVYSQSIPYRNWRDAKTWPQDPPPSKPGRI